MLPTMSRLAVNTNEKVLKLFEGAVRLMIIFGLPMCLLLFISSRPVIILTFGAQYEESIVVLSVLSWSLLFFSLNLIARVFLIANHQQNQWIKMASITYIGYGLACIFFTPLFGYIGLAYTRLASEIVLFAIIYIYIYNTIYRLPIMKMVKAPILSCRMGIIAFYLLANFSLWLKIPAAFIISITGMFILRGIQVHDFQFAKELLISKPTGGNEEEKYL